MIKETSSKVFRPFYFSYNFFQLLI